MNEGALARLELPAIRALLAERTSFAPGRELASALAPTTDLREAERLQDETAAARDLLRASPSSGLRGARDIREPLRRARLGGALDPAQLIAVADTVRAAERLFADVRPHPPLAARTRFARPPSDVASAIENAIGATGEVLDRASARLGSLRADLRAAQARLQQRLDGLVRSPDLARLLQDPIVTQRGGRYVVPVKAEHRAAVKGIVHDQSASGQTVFIEPLEIMEANNTLREAELAESAEVERILDELSRRVERSAEDLDAVTGALAALDLILAKALYADSLEATRPVLNADGILDLVDARHPLLVEQGSVVGIDARLGGDFRVLVITGPNTGGKTVTLKTVGLLTLMAASGLAIPAETSHVPVVRRIFADIGDEQSIAQSLSTFSSHLRNVVATLAGAERGDLALLDEVGAGTDPDEGAALAMAVLETLLERGVLVAATTHYPELKAFALNTPGVRNASMEFDAETLRPTFRLRIGLPGASNAFAIAERLGLDRSVLGRADRHLSELHRSLERTLLEAERERTELSTALEEARVAAADAARVTAEAARKADRLRDDAQRALRTARAEADELLLQARRALRQAEEARDRAAKRNLVDEARAALAEAESARAAAAPAGPPPPTVPIAVGALVHVEGVAEPGTLLAIDDRGMADVAAGALRLRVPAAQLRPAPESDATPRSDRPVVRGSAPSVPLQLDLRGARADEALAVLDRYLNDAAVAGVERLRIVHGKGTGALRAAIRAALAEHPLVREHQPAGPAEGGEGATIVRL
ncbi:MAG TPA: endonuclease MutS2 [Candidatus Limnocylindria bacterium]|jgi:DNA mismatch repair protein MutS2|nr:endonuclease MutS2 [Candidatus Limnocylindria bacterium]